MTLAWGIRAGITLESRLAIELMNAVLMHQSQRAGFEGPPTLLKLPAEPSPDTCRWTEGGPSSMPQGGPAGRLTPMESGGRLMACGSSLHFSPGVSICHEMDVLLRHSPGGVDVCARACCAPSWRPCGGRSNFENPGPSRTRGSTVKQGTMEKGPRLRHLRRH